MPDIPADLLGPRAAARLLGCHLSTLYRMIHDGRLRAWRLGGTHLRVSRADALALLEPVTPWQPPNVRQREYDPATSPGHLAALEKLKAAGYRF